MSDTPGRAVPPGSEEVFRRVLTRFADEGCSGDVVSVETKQATEFFIRCAPLYEFAENAGASALTSRYYVSLDRLLRQGGGDLSQVIHERAFFGDIGRDAAAFLASRKMFFEQAGVPAAGMPALTCLGQPPGQRPRGLEMQAYAVVPSVGCLAIETAVDRDTGATGKRYEIGGRRHLYLSGIQGLAADPRTPGTFQEQSDRMFAGCARLLERHGAGFADVLRTWCYLGDIDHDYASFNTSRSGFFQRHGVSRFPASTGIEARLRPEGARCAMDLSALLDSAGADIGTMKTTLLNEACDYGSLFSRGMRVRFPEKKVLYVSGTASIDEAGKTVHRGDTRAQLERTLLNVGELLAAEGATFDDVVQSLSFLKSGEDRQIFETILGEHGLQSLPNTVVEAGICRPELLCEIEAVAVLAGDGP